MTMMMRETTRRILMPSTATSFVRGNHSGGISRDSRLVASLSSASSRTSLTLLPSTPSVVRFLSTNKSKMSASVLRFKKLSENAFAPVKGSKQAAGFDLISAYDYIVKAKNKELVKTDLQVMIPEGCYGRVAPRSGLAVKNFIDVGAGVVDSDYRGNLGVVLFNFSDQDFQVKKGDRVAQLICEKIEFPELVEEKENLTETERGAGGFGSTGINVNGN